MNELDYDIDDGFTFLEDEESIELTPQRILTDWFLHEYNIKKLAIKSIGLNDKNWLKVIETEKAEVKKLLTSVNGEDYIDYL